MEYDINKLCDVLKPDGHYKVRFVYDEQAEMTVKDLPELYPNEDFIYMSTALKRSICGNMLRFMVTRLRYTAGVNPMTLKQLVEGNKHG